LGAPPQTASSVPTTTPHHVYTRMEAEASLRQSAHDDAPSRVHADGGRGFAAAERPRRRPITCTRGWRRRLRCGRAPATTPLTCTRGWRRRLRCGRAPKTTPPHVYTRMEAEASLRQSAQDDAPSRVHADGGGGFAAAERPRRRPITCTRGWRRRLRCGRAPATTPLTCTRGWRRRLRCGRAPKTTPHHVYTRMGAEASLRQSAQDDAPSRVHADGGGGFAAAERPRRRPSRVHADGGGGFAAAERPRRRPITCTRGWRRRLRCGRAGSERAHGAP